MDLNMRLILLILIFVTISSIDTVEAADIGSELNGEKNDCQNVINAVLVESCKQSSLITCDSRLLEIRLLKDMQSRIKPGCIHCIVRLLINMYKFSLYLSVQMDDNRTKGGNDILSF
ncbi:hypothetical protein KUTeg_019277 [Tegillarca granosa]|uniref:Uncharacterized protein n=1 Tax=Tegillarca granosa TaxID=220873 RepID=A0ABQ9EEM7_TEGGR|nr:hypothetical protein KUTeg_019277 [Tegillarca granosa]